jgi:hypothetical protein
MVNAYLCPVCGYGMAEEPSNFNICPSCGTEFGYHDANVSINTLRATWLRNGAKWWSSTDVEPNGWDPYSQVSNLLSQRFVWQSLMIPAGNVSVKSDLSKMAAGAGGDNGIAGWGQTQNVPQLAMR